jgi:hypothetical protein
MNGRYSGVLCRPVRRRNEGRPFGCCLDGVVAMLPFAVTVLRCGGECVGLESGWVCGNATADDREVCRLRVLPLRGANGIASLGWARVLRYCRGAADAYWCRLRRVCGP